MYVWYSTIIPNMNIKYDQITVPYHHLEYVSIQVQVSYLGGGTII